jgi:hypothetical protein
LAKVTLDHCNGKQGEVVYGGGSVGISPGKLVKLLLMKKRMTREENMLKNNEISDMIKLNINVIASNADKRKLKRSAHFCF